jgi:hypothetical protein
MDFALCVIQRSQKKKKSPQNPEQKLKLMSLILENLSSTLGARPYFNKAEEQLV